MPLTMKTSAQFVLWVGTAFILPSTIYISRMPYSYTLAGSENCKASSHTAT
jgi:hypothetical protein